MPDPIVQQAEPWAVVVEGDSQPLVIERLREYAVTVDQPPDVLVVTAGEQGPPGIPGPAGDSALQRPAGVTLSALRTVYELDGAVYPLDYRDAAHVDLLLGVTLTAAAAGQPVDVQLSGSITDASWSWSPGRVWLGADGALTQTPPPDGFDALIGAATSATTLTLNIQDPIELES